MATAVGGVVAGSRRVLDLTITIQEFRLWMDLTRRRIDSYHALLTDFQKETETTLRSIGYRRWSEFWHIGRQMIGLQQRLLIEQVYSDMGKPWSDLITGFGPLARRVDKTVITDSAARYRARKKEESEAISQQVIKRTQRYRRDRSRRQRLQSRTRRQRARRGELG